MWRLINTHMIGMLDLDFAMKITQIDGERRFVGKFWLYEFNVLISATELLIELVLWSLLKA